MSQFTKGILAAAAALAVAGVSAQAASVTIPFNGTDGETTNLWYGYAAGGSNTGTQQGQLLLSRPADDWYFPASLLRVKNFPADFAGATITSATLTIRDNWDNDAIHQNVEIRRIDTPANWKVGTGAQGDRWPDTLIDDGAGRRVADWTRNASPATGREGVGVDWAGNPVTGDSSANYNSFTTPGFDEAGGAMKDLVTTGMLVGVTVADANVPVGQTKGVATFNLTTLVQNWANGTWDKNDGFAIWMGNSTELLDGNNTQGWSASGANGLTIDYTPVPEPASLSLLALGGLALIRRRAR